MNDEDVTRWAREAGLEQDGDNFFSPSHEEIDVHITDLERFATLVAAAEREKVAAWMIQRSYATGHGDTTEDLLKELEWQVREAEREAFPDLTAVINWLENGCDPKEAAKELRLYSAAISARGQS